MGGDGAANEKDDDWGRTVADLAADAAVCVCVGGGGRTLAGGRRSGPELEALLLRLLRRRSVHRSQIQCVVGAGHRICGMGGNTVAGGGGLRRRVGGSGATGGRRRKMPARGGGWRRAHLCAWAGDRGRLTQATVGPTYGPIRWAQIPHCCN
jgi:hypothetical protein